MKRKVVIIIVVAVFIIAVAAYIIYKNLKKDSTTIEDTETGGETGGGGYIAPAVITSTTPSFPIGKGMSGPQVSAIQDSINKKCKAGLSTDGKFGSKTESALKSCYGVTAVSETLFKQMASGTDCPSGQYKLPGVGCVPIKSTPVAAPTGLQKGKAVYAKMPNLVLFQYPSGNSSMGKIPNNFDISKPIGIYEAVSSEGFSKIWVNVSGVSHSGSLMKAPYWAYVYTSLIK